MRRTIVAAAALSSMAVAAHAAAPTAGASTAIGKLLQDGFEIRTAFYDNQGGAYIILQKATAAFMCHSTNSQTCEKLN